LRRSARSAALSCLLVVVASADHASAQAPTDDVEISVESAPPAPAAPVVPQAPVATQAELNALRAELAALAQRLAEQQEREAKARAEQEQRDLARQTDEKKEAEAKAKADLLARIARAGVSISGYVQVQYGRNELSEDQLLQGGSPLNQNRFAVRRGRLRVNGRWQYVRTDFELDGSNTRGPTTSLRRASVSGVYPSGQEGAPPLLLLTAGLTEIPLGLELQQGQDEILFLERTTGSLAFFAGPVDTGAKLEGAYGPLRAQFAIMNGAPLDDRAGGLSGIDPTNAPDYVGRLGVDAKPLNALRVTGGASFLSGKGFQPGTDAGKASLEWDDADANGEFSLTEVKLVSATGASPSATFDHWAFGADLAFELTTMLGPSKLYGEATLASNLDRGLFVAAPKTYPTLTKTDIRELSWYVAAVQDVTQYGFVGVRYDVYDPNSDLVDVRRGDPVLEDASIKTLSPIVGLRWPDVGRLTFEYDFVTDSLARDARGVPTDVANNQWTLRAQGQF